MAFVSGGIGAEKLEVVLAFADLGKDGLGVCAGQIDLPVHPGRIGAQERIGGDFVGQERRNGGLALGAGGLDRGHPCLKGRVVGIDGEGERAVSDGVFVARADLRIRRQGAQALQAGPHFGGGAFEEAAAAEGHQAIAGKGHGGLGQMKGDVANRVARDVDHLGRCAAGGQRIAGGHRVIQRGQAVGVGGGADHPAARLFLDLGHAVDVIIVMVCEQEIRERPAAGLQGGKNRRGLGGVGQERFACCVIAKKKCVIVLQAGDRHEGKGHGISSGCLSCGRGYGSLGPLLASGWQIARQAAMHLDVQDLRNFYYRSKLGRAAQKVVREKLVEMWPDTTGQTVVGFGFAVPLLRPFLDRSRRVIGLMPAPQGVMPWPAGKKNVSVLCEDTLWPVQTGQVDRLVVLHGLETSDHPSRLLQECWRVLGPGGKAVFIVPNRSGIWSRSDKTPFGYGRPYSLSQLESQLKAHGLKPERALSTLYQSPSNERLWRKLAPLMEKIGRHTPIIATGGVLMVEVGKQVPAPTPPGAPSAVRRPLKVLEGLGVPDPVPAGRHSIKKNRP